MQKDNIELAVIRTPGGDIITKEGVVSTFNLKYRLRIDNHQMTLTQYELDKLFNLLKPQVGKDGQEINEF